jgi:hypothetical protein
MDFNDGAARFVIGYPQAAVAGSRLRGHGFAGRVAVAPVRRHLLVLTV